MISHQIKMYFFDACSIVGMLLVIGCLFTITYQLISPEPIKLRAVQVDVLGQVACGTGSMLPTMACDDQLYLRHFDYTTHDIILGEVYVFVSPYRENETVVHRAVWQNETHVWFKGDNNYIADPPVAKEDIQSLVIGVEYALR